MNILEFMNTNSFNMTIILLLMAMIVLFVSLYMKERYKARKIERSVKEERDFYEIFAQNTKSCYAVLNKKDLQVTYISPNFQTMTGISPEYVYSDLEVGREIVNRATFRTIKKKLADWEQKETLTLEFPYALRGGNGEEKRGKMNVLAEKDRYFVSFFDVTEEYLETCRLHEELAEAEKASQAKTDFLSQMSHEIRTPMNGILGLLSLAKAHIDDTKAVEGYLDKTESLAQFLLTLINDILDMSRIESGKMQLEESTIDLLALADKLNSMFKSTVEDKGIHWKIEMEDFDIRYVIGDELRLSQVIINLISNAHKFTPSGGSVTVTFCEMSKIENNLHLMIRVKDTGKGMEQNFLSRIFRPFEQEDASTARNYGGSGLGMAIADNIIKLMNGQIIVESELGKGSEFIIYVKLPIADSVQDMPDTIGFDKKDSLEEQKRKERIEAFTLEGLHLLFAEDNDINAEVAMEILEMQGAHLVRAKDGEEVVDMFKASEPGTYDAILMDIQMPKMDGWEATKEIRKLQKADHDIPIFAMSANAFVEDKRHSKEVGMNGHITKPIDFEELRRTIAECIC